jgi:TPR repeat protein
MLALIVLPLLTGALRQVHAAGDGSKPSHITIDMALFDFRHGHYIPAYVRFQHAMAKPDPTGEAAYWVGQMRELGLGTPVDIPGAVEAYKTAAADGWVAATARLGHLYFKGVGVDQDFAKARHWLEVAADDNNAMAQVELAQLYEHGWGVRRQAAFAYVWYELAARQGETTAIAARDRILKSMAPDQVIEAQTLLKEVEPGVRRTIPPTNAPPAPPPQS